LEAHINFIEERFDEVTAHYNDLGIPKTNNACESFIGYFRRHQYGKGLRSNKNKSGWFKLVGISFNLRRKENWIDEILLL
jgi:hypothetical protein